MSGEDPAEATTLEADPSPGSQETGEEPIGLTDDERDELVEAEVVAFPVSYSGQDFDIAGLVRRLSNNDILIPIFGHEDERIRAAGFQRSFVWNRKQMDRFIESLLLGYPIPGIFLVRQADRRYLVLDGQQRLRTLKYFYRGFDDGKEFALKNVAERFQDLTYGSLTEEQRRLLDDTFIQATIVSVEGTEESLESIYQIFERLNSGGTPLTPHEIRVALLAGDFIDFLEHLNQDPNWRVLYGKISPRLRDQELILRIIALYLSAPTYRRPLKTFLNGFTAKHRKLTGIETREIEARFVEASRLLASTVGRPGLRLQGYQINAALAEALYVGLMRRLDHGTPASEEAVRAAIESIRDDKAMFRAVSRATADEDSVKTRLQLATAGLAGV